VQKRMRIQPLDSSTYKLLYTKKHKKTERDAQLSSVYWFSKFNSFCDFSAAASMVFRDSVAASSKAWNELEKNWESAKSTIKKPIDDLIPVRISHVC